MSLTAHAEQLADDAQGIGLSAGWVNKSAWSAGVDPEVTSGLVGASLALGGNPLTYHGITKAMPDDQVFIDTCEGLWQDVRNLIRDARELRGNAESRLAKCMNVDAKDKQAVAAAVREAADCRACIDILDFLIPRLDHAELSLSGIPHDLAFTYEPAYDLVRAGHRLPHAGAWVTGATA